METNTPDSWKGEALWEGMEERDRWMRNSQIIISHKASWGSEGVVWTSYGGHPPGKERLCGWGGRKEVVGWQPLLQVWVDGTGP